MRSIIGLVCVSVIAGCVIGIYKSIRKIGEINKRCGERIKSSKGGK